VIAPCVAVPIQNVHSSPQQIAIRRGKCAEKHAVVIDALMLASGLRRLCHSLMFSGGCAPELNKGGVGLYRKPTLLATLLVTDLSQALKVVVEHSRMTDQTHLFGSFAGGGSDHGAAPRTDNIESGFGIFHLVIELMIYVPAHVYRRKQISFQPQQSSRHQ